MKLKIIILFAFLLLAGIGLTRADTDSYTIKWVVPGAAAKPSKISYIAPSFTDKVPYIRLGQRLDFTYWLSLIKYEINMRMLGLR